MSTGISQASFYYSRTPRPMAGKVKLIDEMNVRCSS